MKITEKMMEDIFKHNEVKISNKNFYFKRIIDILKDDEKLEITTNADFKGKKGVLLITNKRTIIIYPGNQMLLNLIHIELLHDKFINVSSKVDMLGINYELIIKNGSESYKFSKLKCNKCEKIKSYLNGYTVDKSNNKKEVPDKTNDKKLDELLKSPTFDKYTNLNELAEKINNEEYMYALVKKLNKLKEYGALKEDECNLIWFSLLRFNSHNFTPPKKM